MVPPRSGHQRAMLGSNGRCHAIPRLGLWGSEVLNIGLIESYRTYIHLSRPLSGIHMEVFLI